MNNGGPAAVQVVHATSHIQRNADTPLIIQLEGPMLPSPACHQQVQDRKGQEKKRLPLGVNQESSWVTQASLELQLVCRQGGVAGSSSSVEKNSWYATHEAALQHRIACCSRQHACLSSCQPAPSGMGSICLDICIYVCSKDQHYMAT